jgi:hypothetical protein
MRKKALTCPQFENGDGIRCNQQMFSAMPNHRPMHGNEKIATECAAEARTQCTNRIGWLPIPQNVGCRRMAAVVPKKTPISSRQRTLKLAQVKAFHGVADGEEAKNSKCN